MPFSNPVEASPPPQPVPIQSSPTTPLVPAASQGASAGGTATGTGNPLVGETKQLSGSSGGGGGSSSQSGSSMGG